MTPLLRSAAVAAALASAALAGCASARPTTTLTYTDRARRDYESALAEMNNGNLLDAQEMFQRVKREYGLSRWGWLADLRLADIEFRQEHWQPAITAYRAWIRYHPTQPEVVYAHFMIARAHYGEIPTDWALAPASWERDQSSTREAADAFERFLSDYPRSEHAAEARTYLNRTRALLAQHEMAVAEFYLTRERPDAAIERFRGVIANYAGSGLEPEAMFRIGETYLQTGRRADAREAFAALVARFPTAGRAESARRYIAFIGPVAPPRAPSPEGPAAAAQPAGGGVEGGAQQQQPQGAAGAAAN